MDEEGQEIDSTDPWFGLTKIDEGSECIYAEIEQGITQLDIAAKMEHPMIEDAEINSIPLFTIQKQSDVAGWGVIYSGTDPLQKGQFVCIYKGALKTKQGLEETRSTKRYLTQLNSRRQIYVDADLHRNFAGFINHSHAPNCDLGVENFHGVQVVVVRASSEISLGDFLSLDYGWTSTEPTELAVACDCRARSCPGTLFQPSLLALIRTKHCPPLSQQLTDTDARI